MSDPLNLSLDPSSTTRVVTPMTDAASLLAQLLGKSQQAPFDLTDPTRIDPNTSTSPAPLTPEEIAQQEQERLLRLAKKKKMDDMIAAAVANAKIVQPGDAQHSAIKGVNTGNKYAVGSVVKRKGASDAIVVNNDGSFTNVRTGHRFEGSAPHDSTLDRYAH